MTTDLARWNLLDYQLQLDSKTEPKVAKAQNYMGRGDTTQKNICCVGGGAQLILF